MRYSNLIVVGVFFFVGSAVGQDQYRANKSKVTWTAVNPPAQVDPLSTVESTGSCLPFRVNSANVKLQKQPSEKSAVVMFLNYGSEVCVSYRKNDHPTAEQESKRWTKVVVRRTSEDTGFVEPFEGYILGKAWSRIIPGQAKANAQAFFNGGDLMASMTWGERAAEEVDGDTESEGLLKSVYQKLGKSEALKNLEKKRLERERMSRLVAVAHMLPMIGENSEYFGNDSGFAHLNMAKDAKDWCLLQCSGKKCTFKMSSSPVKCDEEKGCEYSPPVAAEGTPVFYFSGKNRACSGEIVPVAMNEKFKAGSSISFGKANVTSKKTANERQIVFATDGRAQILERLPEGSGDYTFDLFWAGDFDNDGKVDVLYRFMQSYGEGISGHFKLMLTSRATGPRLFGVANVFSYYNGG